MQFTVKIFTTIMVLAMVLVSCRKGGKAEENSLPEEINFGIQRMPNDEAIAISQGFFDKYFSQKGVKTNFIVFDSGSAVNTALASGSIDFGLEGSSPAVIAKSLGFDIEMIWIHEVLGEIESLAVKNDSGIETLADLVGRQVATPVASTAHYSLLNGLKDAGISEQVEILDMQPKDIVAAWSRGDIEAAYVWQPALANLLEDGQIILSSEDMAAKGFVTANVEVVSGKFARKYPSMVASYIAAVSEAAEIYRNTPSKAAEIVAGYLEISPESALNQMKGSIWLDEQALLSPQYFGTSDAKGELVQIFKDTADFLAEQGSIESAPDLSVFRNFIEPKYIEMAAQILGD